MFLVIFQLETFPDKVNFADQTERCFTEWTYNSTVRFVNYSFFQTTCSSFLVTILLYRQGKYTMQRYFAGTLPEFAKFSNLPKMKLPCKP